MKHLNVIFNENCLTGLARLEDESVDCCVTSPPYFGLRNYGHPDQLGLEETPEEYIAAMVKVFREVKRVLKDAGTLWLNIGDSYCGTSTGSGNQKSSTLQGGKKNQIEGGKRPDKKPNGDIKSKDLIGIPWMLAFALRADGWYLRQDIIWAKPNPMPESVTDRCTKSHEYIFLLSKQQRYYYDHVAIMQESKDPKDDIQRMNASRVGDKSNPNELKNGLRPRNWNGSSFDTGKTGEMKHTNGHLRKSGNKERKDRPGAPEGTGRHQMGSVPWEGTGANKRSVWTVTTKPFKEAHFATFPEELIVDMIKAGCRPDGLVLDVFMGAGTTALVSRKLGRNYVGFEINPEYIKIAEKRLSDQLGMFR